MMTFDIDATFENGILRPKQAVELPEGAEVRISIVVPGHGRDRDPLAQVIGIGDGPTNGDAADRHDDYVYGKE